MNKTNHYNKVLSFIGKIIIVLGIIGFVLGIGYALNDVLSNDGHMSSSAFLETFGLMISSIFIIVNGYIVKEFGDGLRDVDFITAQNNFIIKQNDAVLEVQREMISVMNEALSVLKSLDRNQTVVGNYASEQLCAISNKLSST